MGSQPIRIQLGKILQEIIMGNSCRKFLQENLVGKSCGKSLGKILWEIVVVKILEWEIVVGSWGKFLWDLFKKGSGWWKLAFCGKFGKILRENLAGISVKLLHENLAVNYCVLR